MKLQEAIEAWKPTEKELQIIGQLFGRPEELKASDRVHIDEEKSGPGANPEAFLRFLRHLPQDLRERQECFYLIEALPIPIMELAAEVYAKNHVDRAQNIRWDGEGF